MLFRLLLTLSLIGAWSLPALGCLYNPSLFNPSRIPLDMERLIPLLDKERGIPLDMFHELPQKLFPERRNEVIENERETGGGTWRDSEGREGTYTSTKHTRIVRVRDCFGGRAIGCSDRETFYLYTIELDDGRKEWFTWTRLPIGATSSRLFTASGNGEVKMSRARTADGGGEITITVGNNTLRGDYTLTLVEDKIAGIPSSITYPHSTLKGLRIERVKEVQPRQPRGTY